MSELAGKTILVTGATGFIGGRVVEMLIRDHGAKVRSLVRNFSRASRLARFPIDVEHGDASDAELMTRASEGCDAIINCAYAFSGGAKQRYAWAAESANALTQAASKNSIRRIVHVSSIAVYGCQHKGEADETAAEQPGDDLYAATKLAQDRDLLQQHEQSGLPIVFLRPTIVYGPFSRPWTIGPVSQLKDNRVVLIDGGVGVCNVVYIDDVANAIIQSATANNVEGEEFIISGPQPVSWGDFYKAYESLLGYKSTINVDSQKILDGFRKEELHQKFDYLTEMPGVKQAYLMANSTIPWKLKHKWKDKLFGNEKKRQANAKPPKVKIKAEPEPKPILWPDRGKFELLTSETAWRSDKAREKLNYDAKFDFEAGMQKTAEYLRWARLV